MKKMISLALALALMLSVMPTLPAAAEETETTVPMETAAPTEAVTVPTEEPTASVEETTTPTETATAPTEETTIPTEETTEPAEEETTAPSEETAPTEETTETSDAGISTLSETPAARTIGTDEYGNITFQTLEDLAELTSRTYDDTTNVTYEGTGDLAITRDLTVPTNLYINASNVTVAEGVTVTLGEDASLYVAYLTVAGTLDMRNAFVSVNEALNVTGSVILNGQIVMGEGAQIIGMENIQFATEDSKVSRDVSAHSYTDLRKIAAEAAQDTNSRVSYILYIQPADVTVTESLTLPDNVNFVYVYGNLIIPSGVTMTAAACDITIPPEYAQGGSIHVQSGGTLACDTLQTLSDCTVDGTLTTNTLIMYYDCVFSANGTVKVNREVSIAEGYAGFDGKSTVDISGSLTCGSMSVNLEKGSVALTGELKIKTFVSLEALGLNATYYAATQGSDGFTLISPQEPTFETDVNGHILFKTFEDLKYLLAQPIGQDVSKGYQYAGEDPLVIAESITIPDKRYVLFHEVTVPEGVTLTVTDATHADVLRVDGELILDAGILAVFERLEVSGTVNCGGRVDMYGSTGIIGIENIHCGDTGAVKHYLFVSTPSEWKNALSVVSEYGDSRVQYEIHISDNLTLEQSATVGGADLIVERYESTRTLRIPAGCTLTLNSDSTCLGTIVVEGTLVNNGTLSVSGTMQISGGKFTGNGTLQVYCNEESEIQPKVPGLDLTSFAATKGDRCWVLVPKAIQTLDELVQNAPAEDIKASVQEIGAQQLKDAMEADHSGTDAVAKIQALEEKATGGPAAVEVTQSQTQIDQNKASVVGATLNEVTDPDQPVKLVVDDAKQENNQISVQYDADTAVTFSMTLTNVENPAELSVPVRITLPVPEGIDVNAMTILHYDKDGKVKEEIPYVVNGDGTVSFVVTGFSDFAMVQKAKTLPGDVNGDGEVTDDDVTLLLWHTLFPEENKIVGDADYNHDGSVTDEDVTMLLWYSLFPEDYPLK